MTKQEAIKIIQSMIDDYYLSEVEYRKKHGLSDADKYNISEANRMAVKLDVLDKIKINKLNDIYNSYTVLSETREMLEDLEAKLDDMIKLEETDTSDMNNDLAKLGFEYDGAISHSVISYSKEVPGDLLEVIEVGVEDRTISVIFVETLDRSFVRHNSNVDDVILKYFDRLGYDLNWEMKQRTGLNIRDWFWYD